ncbi:AP-4 complex accessory subunit Tepsin-like isoform X1 [Apostichopus japonicus]|uniref:AP-4 complex accessory subunit Tepsin-like isoform X1 n=1 Tax=Stichopus japonicus TaxID=307972 RepID=UPI003AB779EA
MAAFSGGKLADVFGKVTIVNKWPLLLKATSDDEKPIPGYIYPEVSALTYESSSQQQGTAVLSFLLDRLDKKSWNVKVKVLQIMAYVAIHGECSFRNSLRRQTKSIQEATKYNTAPDPLHGNAPILAVRKAATELLEILFNESLLQKSPSPNSFTGKMEGFGSSPINTHQRTVTDTVKNNLQQLSNAMTLPASQDKAYWSLQSVSNSRNDHPGIHTWNSPTGGEPLSGSYQPVQVDTYDATNDTSNRLGPKKYVVDERWNGEPVFPESVKTSSSSEGHSGGSLDLSQRLEAVAMADWSQEEQLVIDIVSSSERKTNSVPSREEINSFAKRASTLNSEKIIEILVNKMKDSTDAQVGCLCGIEAIVREGLVTGECALPIIQDVLPSLQRSSNSTVRAKASKIQRQLNLCDYQSTVTTKPNPSSGNTTDILVNSDPLESPARKYLFNGMSFKLESQKRVNTVETSLQSPEIVSGVAVPLLVENLNQEPDLIRPVRCLDGSIGKLETQHVDLLSFDGSHQNRNINTPNNLAEDDLILDSICSGAVGHLTESNVEPNVRLKASEHSSKKGEISLAPMDDQLSGFLKSFTSNDGSVSDKIPMKQQGKNTVASAAQQEPSRLLPMNQGSSVNVGELHPQLMGAKMSFQSTVPLQLNNSDDGQFGFISSRSEAASKNSFDFVQEAMKVNRR